jgi:ribosomal protein S18 acetylase RimI-like enzyme
VQNTELAKTNNNILFRNLRKSDLNDFLGLLQTCFTKEFEISGFDPDHVSDMFNRGFGITGTLILGLMRLFGKEPLKFLVAQADGKIVGTTIVNNQRKFGYISTVMVHPDYRRKGIATRLVTDALTYIRGRKMARAVLHVDSTNVRAKNLYVKWGFKTFEHLAYFVRETGPTHALENGSEVKIREFQKDDLDEVYNLIKASEDPNSLRIFDFTKKDLTTPFLQRIFAFATQKRLVATVGNKIVGYVEATYTTPKETGRIDSISVNSEDRSLGIEKLLIEEASREIAEGRVIRIRLTAPTAKQELIEAVKDLGFKEVLIMDAMVKEFQ